MNRGCLRGFVYMATPPIAVIWIAVLVFADEPPRPIRKCWPDPPWWPKYVGSFAGAAYDLPREPAPEKNPPKPRPLVVYDVGPIPPEPNPPKRRSIITGRPIPDPVPQFPQNLPEPLNTKALIVIDLGEIARLRKEVDMLKVEVKELQKQLKGLIKAEKE